MATLRVSIDATGTTTAAVTGSFTGGDSSYVGGRALKITGIYRYAVYAESTSSSGGSSSWDEDDQYLILDGLDPDTTYDWTAVLCYWADGLWTETSYEKSGSFTTDGGGSSGGCVYIYDGSWNPYTPYIYDGSQWVAYDPYFYDGSWNLSG